MDTLTPAAEETRAEDGTPRILDERQRYIDGLRLLASALEQHPEVELPTHGTRLPLNFNLWGDDARERMAAAARAIPCNWRKRVTEGNAEGVAYFDLDGELGGLKIQLTVFRDTVCKRVVVGTEDREVDEVITPAVTKKVTKPVEIVEWDCGSLLAPRAADGEPKAAETGQGSDEVAGVAAENSGVAA